LATDNLFACFKSNKSKLGLITPILKIGHAGQTVQSIKGAPG